jgi:tetratricopeptide (TPR) repeat protein
LKSFFPTLALFGSLAVAITGCGHSLTARDEKLEQTLGNLKKFVLKGEIAKVLPLYREAAEDARARGLTNYQIKFLSNLSSCQFALFQFRAALGTMKEARGLAKKIGDNGDAALIDSNMSSLFLEMGNLQEAANMAEEGLSYSEGPAAGKRAPLFSLLGVIRTEQHRFNDAEREFQRAIDLAQNVKDYDLEALTWDKRALARDKAGNYQQAEQAANRALDLGKRRKLGSVAYSYMILGTIRAAEGNTGAALEALNESEDALNQPGNATIPWLVYMERGKIKIQAADYRAALGDLRKALALAREWRADVPPNDANRTSSEERLAELYQSLVEAGNRLYLQTHEPSLVRETFEAAEENRAASLRALLPQENDWRKKLPAHYYELLFNLQSLQMAQMRRGDAQPSAALADLRSQLSEIEASVGGAEPHRESKALDQAQAMLGNESAFFSFQLGETISWMWAVTKGGISLHAIPSKTELTAKIVAFEKAAGSSSEDFERLGGDLYRTLFGSANRAALARPRWLVALDGPLFDLPFPALSASSGRFLIEDHSFQIAPGALMLRPGGYQGGRQGGFLAVGDPIYNLADPRAKTTAQWPWPGLLTRVSSERGPAFARLWGTAKEIEVSARTWNAKTTVLLTGKQVSPAIFWSKTGTKPDIIHIATHILEENERPQTGWIAFSLGPDAQVQYVTPEDILAKSISARLVVLSGCSSGKAAIQPATGLMGLTRAWIAAGAEAVLATRWPTVDDNGAFFESFYRNLRQNDPIDPAAALQAASKEMLKSGTWRANPSFWAGYFLIGNY